MKCIILRTFWSFIFCICLTAQDFNIGEEFIEPLKYPKFSFTSNLMVNRRFRGFYDQRLRYKLENRFVGAFSFEAGLNKYMNAGASFSFNIPDMKRQEPIFMDFLLFAKPYLSLTNYFGVFSRVSGGLAWGFSGDMKSYLSSTNVLAFFDLNRFYQGQKYIGYPYGLAGSITAGLEYFFHSRFGLAFESGIKVAIFRTAKSHLFMSENQQDIKGSPSSFSFMLYEIPLALTLHVII